MPILDVMDAMDSILSAQAEVEEWKTEFMEEWNMPILKQQMKMQWASMTPEQKDNLKKMSPEMFKQVEQFFGA